MSATEAGGEMSQGEPSPREKASDEQNRRAADPRPAGEADNYGDTAQRKWREWQARAEKAERELAEMRTSPAYADKMAKVRAEKAEARVGELEFKAAGWHHGLVLNTLRGVEHELSNHPYPASLSVAWQMLHQLVKDSIRAMSPPDRAEQKAASGGRWIKCSERMPPLTAQETSWGARLSLPVIALFPSGHGYDDCPPEMNVRGAYFGRYENDVDEWFVPIDDKGGLDRCSSHGGVVPTHWIPLPAPPEAHDGAAGGEGE